MTDHIAPPEPHATPASLDLVLRRMIAERDATMDAQSPPMPNGLELVLRRMIAERDALTGYDSDALDLCQSQRTKLDAHAREMAGTIERLDRMVTERDQTIAALHQLLAVRDARIASLSLSAASRQQLINTLRRPAIRRALEPVLPLARWMRRFIRR